MAAPKKKPKVNWVEKMKADAKSPKKAPSSKMWATSEYSPKEWKAVLKDSPIHGPDYGVGENPPAPKFKKQPAKAPSSSGPKMDKPANANSKPKAKSPAETRKSLTRDRTKPRPARDIKLGDMRSQYAKGSVSTGSKVAKFVGKALGRANIAVDMIANAQPTNVGENEWLSNKGPIMRGTKRKPAPGSNFTPGQGSASAHKKPGKLIYDRVAPEGGATRPTTLRPKPGNFTPSMPAATGAESVSSGPGTSYPNPGSSSKPKTGYPKPSSVGASSSGDSGFSSASASPPAYSAPGGKSRVGGKVTSGVTMFFAGTGGRNHTRPETRYQRDSGLAMDSRKRK